LRIKSLHRRVKLFWTLVIIMGVFMAASSVILVKAATPTTPSTSIIGSSDISTLAITSAVSVTVCGVAAAYALARSGTAAISALVEKPETFFKAFLVVTLCEAIAIYGLVISVLLWIRIPG